ncbi:MAG: ZIP family metal transporter [Planctomycetaceae bacterium]|nr:ZIP family metal transporter [Planctomycetaceae bacterium]
MAATTADAAVAQGPARENPASPLSGPGAQSTSNPATGWLTAGYCALIILASLVGGWIPAFVRLTHTRMQTVISFVGGLMLGIGVFHLLPHAVYELPSATAASRWMMIGIVFMFVMLRLFHFHNHEPDAAHNHDHDDSHAHSAAECHNHGHTHGISWLSITIGLSIHTLIDGIALAASVNSQASASTSFTLFGFGTFLAICLHKPLDAVSITSLMHAGGWSRRRINLVNTGFALMCPLGAAMTVLGVHQFPAFRQEILGPALAFSAGVFICISLSDLLPEMEFHSHNKIQLSVALALGLGLSLAVTLLEPTHLH